MAARRVGCSEHLTLLLALVDIIGRWGATTRCCVARSRQQRHARSGRPARQGLGAGGAAQVIGAAARPRSARRARVEGGGEEENKQREIVGARAAGAERARRAGQDLTCCCATSFLKPGRKFALCSRFVFCAPPSSLCLPFPSLRCRRQQDGGGVWRLLRNDGRGGGARLPLEPRKLAKAAKGI